MPRVTRSRAREERLEGNGEIALLCRLFEPPDEPALGDTQADGPLRNLRAGIYRALTRTAAGSLADDRTLLAQLNERAPDGIQAIERCRRRILADLTLHDNLITGQFPTGLDTDECADRLQAVAREIQDLGRHSDPEQDRFACGVLLMLLELVVLRAHADSSRQKLYERLISYAPTAESELCVVDCLCRNGFTEDVLQPYARQTHHIINTLQRLPIQMQPRSDMIQRLQLRFAFVQAGGAGPAPTATSEDEDGDDDEDEDEDMDED